MEQRYYTRDQVRKLTGVTDVTLDRWSLALRETHMVSRVKRRILFSDDFVKFIRTRLGNSGPPSLPAANMIAVIFLLWRETNGHIPTIAQRLDVPIANVMAQLDSVGLLELEIT